MHTEGWHRLAAADGERGVLRSTPGCQQQTPTDSWWPDGRGSWTAQGPVPATRWCLGHLRRSAQSGACPLLAELPLPGRSTPRQLPTAYPRAGSVIPVGAAVVACRRQQQLTCASRAGGPDAPGVTAAPKPGAAMLLSIAVTGRPLWQVFRSVVAGSTVFSLHCGRQEPWRGLQKRH